MRAWDRAGLNPGLLLPLLQHQEGGLQPRRIDYARLMKKGLRYKFEER
jgi:hypothetical protein